MIIWVVGENHESHENQENPRRVLKNTRRRVQRRIVQRRDTIENQLRKINKLFLLYITNNGYYPSETL